MRRRQARDGHWDTRGHPRKAGGGKGLRGRGRLRHSYQFQVFEQLRIRKRGPHSVRRTAARETVLGRVEGCHLGGEFLRRRGRQGTKYPLCERKWSSEPEW